MACVRPDGTFSETGKQILVLLAKPHTPPEISTELKQPLFLVRSALREMLGAGLLIEDNGSYSLSVEGKEAIER